MVNLKKQKKLKQKNKFYRWKMNLIKKIKKKKLRKIKKLMRCLIHLIYKFNKKIKKKILKIKFIKVKERNQIMILKNIKIILNNKKMYIF